MDFQRDSSAVLLRKGEAYSAKGTVQCEALARRSSYYGDQVFILLGATIGKCSNLLHNWARSKLCKESCTVGNQLPKSKRRIDACMDSNRQINNLRKQ
jgi:hypothetical protein